MDKIYEKKIIKNYQNSKCEICCFENKCSQNIDGKKGDLISFCAVADEFKN